MLLFPMKLGRALEKIANRELRTKSQMAAILLGEAIAEYWRRNPPTPDQSEDLPIEPEPTAAKGKRGKASKGAS